MSFLLVEQNSLRIARAEAPLLVAVFNGGASVPASRNWCSVEPLARTELIFLQFVLFGRLLRRPVGWHLPVEMPIQVPKILQRHQFRVAVSETDVNGPGQSVAGREMAGRAAGTSATVPRDGITAHLVHAAGQRTARIEVAERHIVLGRAAVHPVFVREDRCERWLLDVGLTIEAERPFPRAPAGFAGIEPAVETVTAEKSRSIVRSPTHPRYVRSPLAVAGSWRRFAQGRSGTNADALFLDHHIECAHPASTTRIFVIVIIWMLAVVAGIHQADDAELADIADALRTLRLELRRGQHRQQKCRENREDGDDHEQFDKGEGERTVL